MRPHDPHSRAGWIIAAVVVVLALAPRPSQAAACDDRLHQPPQRLTGSYVAAGEPYARSFVFAMLMDCRGKQEVVTVQRATGKLPLCATGQQVEVTGTLVWNKSLMDGHYEISDPSIVNCRAPGDAVAVTAPVVAPGAVVTPPARATATSTAPLLWHGRYQDNRGSGAATFSLVRGTSTVSGTWKVRTGGGGPVTGLIETDGRRIQLRMENISPECPGTLEGTGEITDTTLVATYRGQDCEGGITDGRLELRLQAAGP